MTTRHRPTPPPTPPNPAHIVGSILAMGVIRLIEEQKRLDKLSEQRVSTDVPTTQEKPRD